jgi:hypothetical protein
MPHTSSVRPSILLTGLNAIFALTLLSGCGKEAPPQVSFSNDIKPIIQDHCIECHKPGGKGYEASGLDMRTYEALMKGTKFGPVIKPGDALSSTLMILIDGRADPSINMPHGRTPLNADQNQKFKAWIDQGAKNN